jgi:hypothetical protein
MARTAALAKGARVEKRVLEEEEGDDDDNDDDDDDDGEEETVCKICHRMIDDDSTLLLCDGCPMGTHMSCLATPLTKVSCHSLTS